MATKVKNMLRNNMVLSILILGVIFAATVFAADFKIKEGAIEEGVVFGDWTTTDSNSDTLVKDEIYKVTSDGFVLFGHNTQQGHVCAYSNGSNPPSVKKVENGTGNTTGEWTSLIPIKKNDYWKVTVTSGTPTIFWLPVGNGECQKQ